MYVNLQCTLYSFITFINIKKHFHNYIFCVLQETFSDNEILEAAQKQCTNLIMVIRGKKNDNIST